MLFFAQDRPGISSLNGEGLQVGGLFAIPIQITNGDEIYNFSEKELSLIKNTKFQDNVKNSISSSVHILDDLNLINLKNYIQKYLNYYIYNVIHIPQDVKIKVTTSWVNKTNNKQSHHSHSHPNSFVSGVVYLTPNNLLNFFHPGSSLFLFSRTLETNFGHPTHSFVCQFEEIGSLVLFPSSLFHSVPEYDGKEPRYSLSFNTMIYGKIGDGVNQLVLPESN